MIYGGTFIVASSGINSASGQLHIKVQVIDFIDRLSRNIQDYLYKNKYLLAQLAHDDRCTPDLSAAGGQ